jgi:hypothetical protein
MQFYWLFTLFTRLTQSFNFKLDTNNWFDVTNCSRSAHTSSNSNCTQILTRTCCTHKDLRVSKWIVIILWLEISTSDAKNACKQYATIIANSGCSNHIISTRHTWSNTQHKQHCRCHKDKNKPRTNSVSWVRERTILTYRPLFVGEVSANFCG